VKPFTIKSAQAFALRAPIEEPITTSFGIMRDRPAVLIRIADTDGIAGWGEAWCNFPACAAEHRVNLLETEVMSRLVGLTISDPLQTFRQLTNDLQILVNQSGEAGPVAQVLAGIDIALWDIASRREDQPLWRYLGGATDVIRTYASGINPDNPTAIIKMKLLEGYDAFKIKVGFGEELDCQNLESARKLVGPDRLLMADANQGWNLPTAKRMIESISHLGLLWIEEPLPVHSSQSDWELLSQSTSVALASGENIRGERNFMEMIDRQIFRYIQPDVGKWGGISGCLTIAKYTLSSGATYCPHWLGSSIGLMASAHLLAATGGFGQLEVDANPNPLRDDLFTGFPTPSNGTLRLDDSPGLGGHPNPELFEKYAHPNSARLDTL